MSQANQLLNLRNEYTATQKYLSSLKKAIEALGGIVPGENLNETKGQKKPYFSAQARKNISEGLRKANARRKAEKAAQQTVVPLNAASAQIAKEYFADDPNLVIAAVPNSPNQ